jgi:hypothetical protein
MHILVVGEAPSTHVVEVAGHRIGRTGKADEEYAGQEIFFHFERSFRFGRPPVAYPNIGIRETSFIRPFGRFAALSSRLSQPKELHEMARRKPSLNGSALGQR